MSYAYLQTGQDAEAAEAREVLFSAGRIMENFATAYAYAAVAVRIELELGDWERAANIAPRQPTGFPWDDMELYWDRAVRDKYRKMEAAVQKMLVESPNAPPRAMVLKDVEKLLI